MDVVDLRGLDRTARQTEIQAEIQRLKLLNNSLAPISSLPAEILIDIFTWYRDYCYNDPFQMVFLFNWIQVTHVCSRWRAIALENPRLWSVLRLDSRFRLKAFEVIFERSRTMPLSVYVSSTITDPGQAFLLDVMDHIHRFEHLDLTISHEGVVHLFQFIWMAKISEAFAPILRTLIFRNIGGDYEYTLASVFGEGTPALRHLHLYNCPLRKCPAIIKGLTHLQLGLDDLALNPSGDLCLFEALKEMVDLRKFIFADNRSRIVEIPQNDNTIALPKLEFFSFDGSLPLFSSFLRRLSIPSSAFLQIVVKTDIYYEETPHHDLKKDFDYLIMALESSWQLKSCRESLKDRTGSTLQRIWTGHYGLEDVAIHGWLSDTVDSTQSSPEYIYRNPPGLVPNLNITFLGFEPPPWTTIRCALVTFPLQDLTCIHLGVVLRKRDCAILARLPALRLVSLTQICFADFFNYIAKDPVFLKYHHNSRERGRLMTTNAQQGTHLPPPKYFPKLDSISFQDADFGLLDYEADDMEDEAIDMELFIEFLSFRKRHSSPIRHLRLESCYNVIEEEVYLMKEMIEGLVEWDGWTNIREDLDLSECDSDTSGDDDDEEEGTEGEEED
ncbi:hypothetical protein CVT24_004406 [Panaeolus cyanescens]|uniref:F-box domain-containing protein n=1 Tax=Panaeolus cyanescens TaxID=181874 RepID=A0A409YBI9_9AGAR|nr:hypothetical protein CVT24_004406 [Panaeolus cyanescens]